MRQNLSCPTDCKGHLSWHNPTAPKKVVCGPRTDKTTRYVVMRDSVGNPWNPLTPTYTAAQFVNCWIWERI